LKYAWYPLFFTLLLSFFPSPLYSVQHLLSEAERHYLEKNPVLRVSNEKDRYPHSFFSDKEPHGYIIDYMKFLAGKIGVELQFITGDPQELASQLDNGILDILVPVFKPDASETKYLYSDAIMEVRFSFVVKSSETSIRSLEDLLGKKLAVEQGWKRTEYVERFYPEIELMHFPTSKEALEAVAFGLADASIEDFIVANYIMNRYMLGNLQTVNQSKCDVTSDDTMRMAFAKDAPLLKSIFDKAIQSLSEEEQYALHQKWFQHSQPSPSDTLALTAEEERHLRKKGQINMCIDPDWMPLEAIHKGEHIGMSRDYMELIHEKINTPIVMVPTDTWLESIEKAKARECDIYSLAMPTPERKLYMNFTKPYLKIPLVLATRPDELFFTNISLIRDKPIGIVKGYAYGEILRVNYPQMHFVEVANVNDGLSRVHRKELFGFIGTLATVGYAIQKEFTSQLKIAGKFDETWELGVGVRNDDPYLFSIFEKAIASIDEEAHQHILNKWISVQYEKSSDYTFIFKVLGIIVLILLYVLFRQRELKRHNHQLTVLSSTDTLTGIYNRMKLDELLAQEYEHAKKHQQELSLIIIDIDDFKEVNDQFGHKVGDQVLKTFAHIIEKEKRTMDIFGRWGGEEFLLVCKETNAQGALVLSNKIKNALAAHPFDEVGHKTACFGITQFQKNDTIESAFVRADKALYQAKSSGKDQIRTF
jgi:polar amino acid transport system substrate-binding protein